MNIGKLVRIIDENSKFRGEIGRIIEITDTDFLIELLDGTSFSQEGKLINFKKGTKVEFKKNQVQSPNLPYEFENKRKRKKTPKLKNVTKIVRTELYNRDMIIAKKRRTERLELKTKKYLLKNEMKNKRVRIINSFNPYYLFLGEIVSKGKYTSKIKIDFRGIVKFNNSDFQREDFSFDNNAIFPLPKNHPYYFKQNTLLKKYTFNVGNNVIVTNKPGLVEKGKIIKKYENNYIRIKLNNGKEYDIDIKNLKHDHEKNIIDRDTSLKRTKEILEEKLPSNKRGKRKKPEEKTEKQRRKRIRDNYNFFKKKTMPDNDIFKNYSYEFYLDFETQVNNKYYNDHGTMYYPYEKHEFFLLLNRNRRYLNVKQGKNENPLMSIIIKSDSIAVSDINNNNTMKIKMGLLKLLFDSGANVNLKDKQGKTPLMIAYEYNYSELFFFLLERLFADPLIEDKSGNTIYKLAKKDKKKNIVDLIDKYVNNQNDYEPSGIESVEMAKEDKAAFGKKNLLDMFKNLNFH
jgi:ankyrin repeat protein